MRLGTPRQAYASVPDASVQRIPPGESALPGEFAPGDFILTHGHAWTSQLIRFGQRIRFRGGERKYSHWNHAALLVSAEGDLVEALGAGVQKRNLSVYDRTEYHLVRITASDEDCQEVVAFGN